MGLSLPHLLVVLVVILIVFGAGRLPKVMEDLGKGLKSFKNAMNDNPTEKPVQTVQVETKPTPEQKDI